ncbi:DNA-directed DNA polymerase [Sarracenia purpurea var. burkii]
MASDSPRKRIDQFFANKKKKKSPLPCPKYGIAEKDSKVALEGSPSAKGSLDGYLLTSQDGNCTSKPLPTAHVSSARQDPVKRNLTLEINLLTKDENKNVYMSTPCHSQTSEPYGEARKQQSQIPSYADDASIRCLVNSDSADSAGNSELKQFATDFLSLYCSELPPSASTPLEAKVNAHKRQISPSVIAVDDKLSNKRHCIIDGNESHADCEATCSDEKHRERMESGVILECREAFIKGTKGMNVGTLPIETQVSLRKCNRTSAESLYITGCDSPAMTTRIRETPMSTRGNSIFSPGEAFWNEAIQVADGFLMTNDNLSVQVAGEFSVANIQSGIKNLNNLSNAGCGDMPNKIFNQGSRVGGVEMNSSIGSPGKHGNGFDKEASPLPVKHFDFSFEDRNMFEDTLYTYSGDNKNDLIHKKAEQLVQKATTSCDTAKRKVGSFSQGNDRTTSSTPDKEKRDFMANGTYGDDSTPSSSVLLKDCLDLSYWLPLEICNIYKKRGISKLYSWQDNPFVKIKIEHALVELSALVRKSDNIHIEGSSAVGLNLD